MYICSILQLDDFLRSSNWMLATHMDDRNGGITSFHNIAIPLAFIGAPDLKLSYHCEFKWQITCRWVWLRTGRSRINFRRGLKLRERS